MTRSIETTFEIAQWQKNVLYCFIANLLCLAMPLLFLVMVPVQLYCSFRMARALGFSGVSVALFLIGMFLPLVSLILLVILTQNATRAIRSAGFNVGLMGADLKEIMAKAVECPPVTADGSE